MLNVFKNFQLGNLLVSLTVFSPVLLTSSAWAGAAPKCRMAVTDTDGAQALTQYLAASIDSQALSVDRLDGLLLEVEKESAAGAKTLKPEALESLASNDDASKNVQQTLQLTVLQNFKSLKIDLAPLKEWLYDMLKIKSTEAKEQKEAFEATADIGILTTLWANLDEILPKLKNKYVLVEGLLSRPNSEARRELIKSIRKIVDSIDPDFDDGIWDIFAVENFDRGTIFKGLMEMAKHLDLHRSLADTAFKNSETVSMTDVIKTMIDHGDEDDLHEEIIPKILAIPDLPKKRELIRSVLKKSPHWYTKAVLASEVFSQPDSAKMADELKLLIPGANTETFWRLATNVFTQKFHADKGAVLEEAIKQAEGDPVDYFITQTAENSKFGQDPRILRVILEKDLNGYSYSGLNRVLREGLWQRYKTLQAAAKIYSTSERRDFILKKLGPLGPRKTR